MVLFIVAYVAAGIATVVVGFRLWTRQFGPEWSGLFWALAVGIAWPAGLVMVGAIWLISRPERRAPARFPAFLAKLLRVEEKK